MIYHYSPELGRRDPKHLSLFLSLFTETRLWNASVARCSFVLMDHDRAVCSRSIGSDPRGTRTAFNLSNHNCQVHSPVQVKLGASASVAPVARPSMLERKQIRFGERLLRVSDSHPKHTGLSSLPGKQSGNISQLSSRCLNSVGQSPHSRKRTVYFSPNQPTHGR